uniref:Uncharacterized protein n=1 Tax=Panagrellus redivivus TaxID=6233 RepID=A0A7E4VIZ9_PANRE
MKVSVTVCVVAILLVCVSVDAKKPKHEEVKGKAKPEKVKKHVPVEVTVEKVPTTEPVVEAPAPKIVVKVEEPVIEVEEPVTEAPVTPKRRHFKLKVQKQPTEYDLCKQECRKKRDEASAAEYITQLEEELRLAKENLAQQEEAAANGEANILETGNVEQPIIEVNVHQTKHDL